MEHINKRHVDVDKEHGASKFLCFFNLTPTLAFIVQKTFLGTQDYYIMEEGYKAGHGYYYIYVFKNEESNGSLSVGLSHRQDLHLLLMEGGLRQQIQEYYSVRYPFSRAYHFLKQRRNGMAPF